MRSYFNFASIGIVSLFQEKTINAFDVDPYPTFRFREYSELSIEQKSAATLLGYNEIAWNQPSTARVESLSWWYNVNMDYYDVDQDGDYYEPNSDFSNATVTLGFVGDEAEDVWDCWINHYSYYSWDDLVKYDIAPFYMDLGWTPGSWNETLPEPASNSKFYAELTDKEKTAALTVCYTQKLWDYEELPFCLDSPGTIDDGPDTCDWVSMNISRCSLGDRGVSEHCPNTCGSCIPHNTSTTNNNNLASVSRFVLSASLSCFSILVFFALN